jgi:hypothetical protein
MEEADSQAPEGAEESAELLWGAVAIANFVGRNPRQTYWMLEKGTLPAKKIGKLWVGRRSTLRALFMGEGA